MLKVNLHMILIVALLPVLAAAGEVDETRPAAKDGSIEIEAIGADVRLTGWDRPEIRITGSVREEYEELEISGSERRTVIELTPLRDEYSMKGSSSRLEIRAPRGSSVELELISGDITIEDIEGETVIETVSSSVDISGAMRDIEVANISGRVSVRLDSLLRRGEFETVSGDIELEGALGDGAELSVETVNGNVTLRLPSGTSARFDVDTFNGDIRNDFGPKARKTSKYLPAKSLSFTTGSGDARVTVEAFNGTVRLVRE